MRRAELSQSKRREGDGQHQQGDAIRDGYRWKFQQQDAGKRTRYASKPRGIRENSLYIGPKKPRLFALPLKRVRADPRVMRHDSRRTM